MRILAPAAVPRLLKEGSLLEYLQVLFYVAAALMGLVLFLASGPRTVRWALVMFALACMLVAAEEVSWGERLLRFDSREPLRTLNSLRELNTQNETNLHNLAPVQPFLHCAYILMGLGGGVRWRVRCNLPRGWLRQWLEVMLPDRSTTFLFLPVALFYLWMEISGAQTEGWLRSQDQEVFEALLAAGFAVFS